MKFTAFTDLCVFERGDLNKICDRLYSEVLSVYSTTESMLVCGSVAKIFDGKLSEDYVPKDLDLVCLDYLVYRMLKNRLPFMFPHFRLRVDEQRMVLFTNIIAIEIWKPTTKERVEIYKEKIAYTL